MSDILYNFPIVLLIVPMLFALFYCMVKKKEAVRPVGILTLLSFAMIILYPIVIGLGRAIPEASIGYTIGKFLIFVFLPAGTIFYIEKWSPLTFLRKTGVRRRNIDASILLGLVAAAITILVTVIVASGYVGFGARPIILFIESFTEEFFFRGVLLLYLAYKTDLKLAYVVATVSFIVIHPQHFNRPFIISTIAQSVLLGIVAYKTKNIMGTWVAHGLNRIVPSLIRVALG